MSRGAEEILTPVAKGGAKSKPKKPAAKTAAAKKKPVAKPAAKKPSAGKAKPASNAKKPAAQKTKPAQNLKKKPAVKPTKSAKPAKPAPKPAATKTKTSGSKAASKPQQRPAAKAPAKPAAKPTPKPASTKAPPKAPAKPVAALKAPAKPAHTKPTAEPKPTASTKPAASPAPEAALKPGAKPAASSVQTKPTSAPSGKAAASPAPGAKAPAAKTPDAEAVKPIEAKPEQKPVEAKAVAPSAPVAVKPPTPGAPRPGGPPRPMGPGRPGGLGRPHGFGAQPVEPPPPLPPPPPPKPRDMQKLAEQKAALPKSTLEREIGYPLVNKGKVREVYQVGRGELLLVATDRVSAFDVIMGEEIPRKGEVLTMLTAWWCARLEPKGIEHHLIAVDPEHIVRLFPKLAKTRKLWERRAMLVRRTSPVPIECVVRAYLSGSAWKEYMYTHMVAGERLPEGMLESQRLPRALFSPATKATEGHDENITPAEVGKRVGERLAQRLERLSLRIFDHGRRAAEANALLLADTKYEFGFDMDGRLLLIDEVMTPDSSRYWPKQSYAPGRGQPSLDKQPIRDWLEGEELKWDFLPPPPKLPPEVVKATTDRYLELFRRLTGIALDDFQPPLLGIGAP